MDDFTADLESAMTTTLTREEATAAPLRTAAREKVEAYLTYRERRLDPTFNPFARPHPELPWIDRGLPWQSCSATTGPMVTGGGHLGHRNDFPLPPPPERAARRVAVERPERIA